MKVSFIGVFFSFSLFFLLTKSLKNEIILYLQETAKSVFGPISCQKRHMER